MVYMVVNQKSRIGLANIGSLDAEHDSEVVRSSSRDPPNDVTQGIWTSTRNEIVVIPKMITGKDKGWYLG